LLFFLIPGASGHLTARLLLPVTGARPVQ